MNKRVRKKKVMIHVIGSTVPVIPRVANLYDPAYRRGRKLRHVIYMERLRCRIEKTRQYIIMTYNQLSCDGIIQRRTP